jgi:hypothetical protein
MHHSRVARLERKLTQEQCVGQDLTKSQPQMIVPSSTVALRPSTCSPSSEGVHNGSRPGLVFSLVGRGGETSVADVLPVQVPLAIAGVGLPRVSCQLGDSGGCATLASIPSISKAPSRSLSARQAVHCPVPLER